MKDICDIMYTHMGNYIICLLIDGIFAKISNINIIKQKHLVRLCQDFELFVKFKFYKIIWYSCKGGLFGGGSEDRGGESRAKPQSSSHYTNLYILVWFV